mmetsp:Transcript_58151/g.135441  ORF Transcript_58151/g.135441 Transcript_58151/m.135441 type:complete len:283 (-) Transcript_58151:449-1297(-)
MATALLPLAPPEQRCLGHLLAQHAPPELSYQNLLLVHCTTPKLPWQRAQLARTPHRSSPTQIPRPSEDPHHRVRGVAGYLYKGACTHLHESTSDCCQPPAALHGAPKRRWRRSRAPSRCRGARLPGGSSPSQHPCHPVSGHRRTSAALPVCVRRAACRWAGAVVTYPDRPQRASLCSSSDSWHVGDRHPRAPASQRQRFRPAPNRGPWRQGLWSSTRTGPLARQALAHGPRLPQLRHLLCSPRAGGLQLRPRPPPPGESGCPQIAPPQLARTARRQQEVQAG